MLKFLSFIPKTLHQAYSAVLSAFAIIIYGSGAFLLAIGVIGVLLYAVVGFLLATLVCFLFTIPNKLLLKIAQAMDPEYHGKNAFSTLAHKAAETVPTSDISPNGAGDLADLLAGTKGDKSGWTGS